MKNHILILSFLVVNYSLVSAQTNILGNSDFEEKGAWNVVQANPGNPVTVTFGSSDNTVNGGSGANLVISHTVVVEEQVFVYQALELKAGNEYSFSLAINNMTITHSCWWLNLFYSDVEPTEGNDISETVIFQVDEWHEDFSGFDGLIDTFQTEQGVRFDENKFSVDADGTYYIGICFGGCAAGEVYNFVLDEFKIIEPKDLSDGLVAYLPFNGNTKDSLLSSEGIYDDTHVSFTEGVSGQAASFSGAEHGSYIIYKESDFALPMGNESYSISLWLKSNGNKSGLGMLVTWGVNGITSGSNNQCVQLATNNNSTVRSGLWGNDYNVDADASTGEWEHLATTYNDGYMELYLNGELVSSGPTTIDSADIATNPFDIWAIGALNSPDSIFASWSSFQGDIDEVRIYNKVLSTEDVVAIYALDSTSAKSSDATLLALSYGGTPVALLGGKITYDIILPSGTSDVPLLGATTTSDKAKLDIVDAIVLPGNSTVTVTAENGNIVVYTVNFTVGKSNDATLSGISLTPSADLTPTFSPNDSIYAVELPAGTTTVNIQAEATNDSASVSGIGDVDVTFGSGSASIVVTSEDESAIKTYIISFTVISDITPINNESISAFFNNENNSLVINNPENVDVIEIYSLNGVKICTFSENIAENIDLKQYQIQSKAMFFIKLMNHSKMNQVIIKAIRK